MTIEVTWIVIPLLLDDGSVCLGGERILHPQRPPPGALEINVIGKQWMWKVQHRKAPEINDCTCPWAETSSSRWRHRM